MTPDDRESLAYNLSAWINELIRSGHVPTEILCEATGLTAGEIGSYLNEFDYWPLDAAVRAVAAAGRDLAALFAEAGQYLLATAARLGGSAMFNVQVDSLSEYARTLPSERQAELADALHSLTKGAGE
ncbi:hypothetical protein [Nocardia wallacei]|uniref:hypothetical protein n=1 Tax=Nocardia wallacei TaxID=480035 RepID=UPI00245742C6|nr:hypothetical protein [Nocardia wallacei]